MARKTRKSDHSRVGVPPAAVQSRATVPVAAVKPAVRYAEKPECLSPLDGIVLEDDGLSAEAVGRARSPSAPPSETHGRLGQPSLPDAATISLEPIFRDDAHGIWLYHGNCLSILDAIYAKHGEAGCFDMIFADPPYFLSNGGITCHAGRMVKVDKGDWDRSRGAEENHNFNREWLRRCQRVLKPNGTIWVTGTHHVIFSVGYAMQQLGFKILNDIAWEKPNPPPNLSCRYFTHSTETVLWAAKTEKSRHIFNYKAMKAVTGKQMKTVWKMPAPGKTEKIFGKHPTQKPVALVERCLLASTHEGDLVLDAFMGAGTTAVACFRQGRHFVGIELDLTYLLTASKRADREVIEVWLREFRVRVGVSVVGHFCEAALGTDADSFTPKAFGAGSRPTTFLQNDLDPKGGSMDRIGSMANEPEIVTERIFHETKFVFLSCAQVRAGSVVHTTVDADVQSAWSHTPQSIKLATTHIVRCETEIFRVK
ncbi:MAG: site-specific DNA-methyltransferase [Verrucomicrobiia bacterium]